MKNNIQYAKPMVELRNWVLSGKQSEQTVEVLVGLLTKTPDSKSQKSTESLWDLLLNFSKIDFHPTPVEVERIKRQAWSELIPEIPKLLTWIESAQHKRETGSECPSDFSLHQEFHFERDLRGVECPRNYVKASVILKRLPDGAQLDLLLDPGQPIENVPMRLRGDGYEILNRTKEEDHWRLEVLKAFKGMKHFNEDKVKVTVE